MRVCRVDRGSPSGGVAVQPATGGVHVTVAANTVDKTFYPFSRVFGTQDE